MKITKTRVIELLQNGWELGHSNGGAWMQKKLCCGGESHRVHVAAFSSLRKSGEIVRLPRRDNDAFWLYRYGLKQAATPTTQQTAGENNERKDFV